MSRPRWVKSCSRDLWLDIVASDGRVGGENARQVSNGKRRSQFKELLVGWGEDPTERAQLPHFVFVRDGVILDFLAWSSTFLQNVRPISAFCRVLDWDKWRLDVLMQPPRLKYENAAIGAVIAEALSHQSSDSEARLSTRACMSTFSFTMARSFALGFSKESEAVTTAWLLARRLTRQPERALTDQQIGEVWSAFTGDRVGRNNAASLYSRPKILRQTCDEFAHIGEITDSTWAELTLGLSQPESLRTTMQKNREIRVRELERVLEELTTAADIERASFLAGFLCSLVSPGTLDHWHLLRPTMRMLPSALLWYGICAGLHIDSKVLDFQDGLGRRILRELMVIEDLTFRPRSDISVEELDVLLTGDIPDVQFPIKNSGGYLDIEIAPGVLLPVHWPLDQPIADNRNRPHTDALLELGETLRVATELHHRALADMGRRKGGRRSPTRR